MCGFSAIPADFLQQSAEFFATLGRFSVISADLLQHSADFLQYLQIFCNICRFSAIPADFLQRPADFLQHLQIFYNTMQNFSVASSDDINTFTAQRSSVVLFPWWLMVFSACLQIYPNFIRSQPRAYHVTSMLLLSKAIYSCWK